MAPDVFAQAIGICAAVLLLSAVLLVWRRAQVTALPLLALQGIALAGLVAVIGVEAGSPELIAVAVLVLAFPILVINIPMSAIRQAEAIGIMCFAFAAFVDRKLLRYVALVGLAVLFHRSAMIFLAFAPFIHLQFTKRNVAFSMLLALPGLYLMTQTAAADEAMGRYVGTGVDAAGAAFRLLVLVLSGALYLLKIRPLWKRQFPQDYKLVTIAAWLMVASFGLFFVSSVIGDRFGYYLIPLQLVIFVRIPYLQGLRNRQLWTFAPYALLTTVFFVWTQLSWHFQQCYVPYQFGIYSDS